MSATPTADTLEDLVENAIIRELNTLAIIKACNPDHWDSDRKYKLPNLAVKCQLGEELIPYYRVYAIRCEIILDGKPTRYTFKGAWKALRDKLEDAALHTNLTDAYIYIGAPAEDLVTQPNISGDLRKRILTFVLRGYSKI